MILNRAIVSPLFLRSAAVGQSLVEYAGMIVLSTVMVAGLMSATKQILPVIFSTLSQHNSLALYDAPPAPASSLPRAVPANERTGTGSLRTEAETAASSSKLETRPAAPAHFSNFSLIQSPPLTMTQTESFTIPDGPGQMPEKKPENLHSGQNTGAASHAEFPPTAPRIFPGPAAAPPVKVAPSPRLAPEPKQAPPPMNIQLPETNLP